MATYYKICLPNDNSFFWIIYQGAYLSSGFSNKRKETKTSLADKIAQKEKGL